MTNEPLKATQPLPDAYLFSNEWGEQELLLSCHGEQAQRLLEHGWTCSELFARAPSHHDLIEALRGVMDILGRAESNASGNPEWDYVGPRVAKARAILTKEEAS